MTQPLKERLVAQFPNGGDGEYADLYDINPDGPEALARIEVLTDALDVAMHRFKALDTNQTEPAIRGFARKSVELISAALNEGTKS